MESNGTTTTNGGGGGVHNGQSTTTSSIPEYHRLCHVIKRSNFSGYGFHLHAEKGKPGQFIGKVDPDSPAEEAGMRQGDRIIEVNNVPINQETHKEVVERIKALEQEVRLLVLDASQDPTGTALAKKESAAAPTNGTKVATTTTTTTSTTKTSTTLEKNGHNNGSATKIESMTTTTSSSTKNGGAGADDLSSDLLSLSVAEFRAKLANKKKVDPKRESVDIKKKYEMVQML